MLNKVQAPEPKFERSLGARLLKIRFLRRQWQTLERWPPFLKIFFSKEGMGCHKGRVLIWGKFRRIWLSIFPFVSSALQKHYGLQGQCEHCSTSCKLLMQCPHWDDKLSRCGVYDDRPNICRSFPITPADIRDRDLANPDKPCGFKFKK